MEQSWENFPFSLEMIDDRDLLEECQTDEEEFLRDILSQTAFSSETETQPLINNNLTATTTFSGSSLCLSSDGPGLKARPSSTPMTCILSFDSSTIIPATATPQPLNVSNKAEGGRGATPFSSKKRTLQNDNSQEPKPKRGRSGSQVMDHIMAERKRRQELTERFIALSATIPGLKKTDKSSILREAIAYMKKLQERVTELEQRNKRVKESIIILKKTDLCAKEDITTSEPSYEDCFGGREMQMLPDIEARVMENEILIEIHCEKLDGVQLKILDYLENLQFCVTASSVLPFGNSTLGITIVAQMGDAYRVSANDLVKNLRQMLLNIRNVNGYLY